VGMISGFRSALLHEAFRWDCIGTSALATMVVLVVSLFYFRRMERRFADVI
jgi:ABC-type polysaccharide/polyol phosphate export permease